MNQNDINALLNNTATIESKIEILPKKAGEQIITITNENSIKSWTYSDLRYVEDVGFIGQFVARTLDGELQDITDDFNIQDREIKLYIGIRVPNAQGVYNTTYYCLGNFLVQAPESDEVNDNTKFESFDYTILFNKEFDGDFKNYTYTKSFNEYINNQETVTALWLAQYVCAQAGVTLGTTDFLNKDFKIETNQFDSTFTCRDVVKAIAKLAYTWARIGWDNKLYFDFKVKSSVEQTYNNVTNDNYYSLITQKEKYGPVNRVLIGTSFAEGDNEHIDDAASIAANGLHELFIYDNPLTYTEDIRKQVISSGSCLFGLTYTAVDMETTGHPWLQGNELISIEDMEGNKLYTYPFDRVLKYSGHIKSQITSYATTGQEESMIYDGNDSDYGKYKKTQIILDRQNQEITALSQKIDSSVGQFQIANESSGKVVTTEKAGNYLPVDLTFYGDSYQESNPTPTNPSEIDVVDGFRTILDTKTYYDNVPVTRCTKTKYENDSIEIEYEANADAYIGNVVKINNTLSSNERICCVSIKPNTKYVLSCDTGFPKCYISVLDENYTNLEDYIKIPSSFEKANYEFTTYANASYLYIRLGIEKSSETSYIFKNIRLLEKEDYDKNSERLLPILIKSNNTEEKIVNIPIGDNGFASTFNGSSGLTLRDTGYIDFSTSKLVKEENINRIILNGNENWSISRTSSSSGGIGIGGGIGVGDDSTSSNTYKTTLTLEDPIENISISSYTVYCDYFRYVSPSSISKGNYTIWISSDGKVNIRFDSMETVDEFKEWLKDNNVTIYCPLETSVTKTVDIDSVTFEQLRLSQGHNEINIIDDLKPDMYLKYLTDSELNVQYVKMAELQLTNNQIRSDVSETTRLINVQLDDVAKTLDSKLDTDNLTPILANYASTDSVLEVENKVTEIQTSTSQYIGVVQDIQQNGVSQVRTETGFTFDKNGLLITKDGANTKSLFDEDGMKIYSTAGSSQQEMQRTDSTGTYSENVTVRKYLVVGTHSRLEDYSTGTGVFFIG